MLRRKILARVGLLALAFVLGSVAAVLLLQNVLGQLEGANRDAAVLVDGVQTLGTAVGELEAARRDGGETTARGEAAVQEVREAMDRIGGHASVSRARSDVAAAYSRVATLLGGYLEEPASVVGAPRVPADEVRAGVDGLGKAARDYVAGEQMETFRHFRTMVLVLTLAALVMLNTSIFVLLNLAQMVLKPVSSLVEGARELAAEHFDHRVELKDEDEFGELALSYNRLAEQLRANEERKTETLRQLAVTLNHGLNNVMAIIELQLRMLDRQSGGNPTLAAHLREIRGCLNRMAGIVGSLKNIRRVVLTDYAPGLKMIDLERSVGDAEPTPGAAGATGA